MTTVIAREEKEEIYDNFFDKLNPAETWKSYKFDIYDESWKLRSDSSRPYSWRSLRQGQHITLTKWYFLYYVFDVLSYVGGLYSAIMGVLTVIMSFYS